MRIRVGSIDELRNEGCRVVTVRGRQIGVLSANGEFFAVLNRCPHKGAPLCKGTVSGTFIPSRPHEYVYAMEGRVLRCPWHGWEFDLSTGRSLFQPDKVRAKVYPVTVEGDEVILHA